MKMRKGGVAKLINISVLTGIMMKSLNPKSTSVCFDRMYTKARLAHGPVHGPLHGQPFVFGFFQQK